MLPDPVPPATEDDTGAFPAIARRMNVHRAAPAAWCSGRLFGDLAGQDAVVAELRGAPARRAAVLRGEPTPG